MKFRTLLIVSLFLMPLAAIFAIGTVRDANASGDTSAKSAERLVVVHDGERERGFLTTAKTIREALDEARISLDANDLIEPGLNEKLIASSYDVNIYRARPVVVIDGAVRKKIMSAYRTPAQIIAHAEIEHRDEDITELSMPVGGAVQLTIQRATAFTLVLYGKKTTAYTQAATVGEMLDNKGISLGENDVLSLDKSTPMTADLVVELWREGKQTITQDEEIAFKVEQIQDVDKQAGFKEIKTPGTPGKRTVTYEIEMKNGVEVSRQEIQSVTLVEPKPQVEIVGVKNNYSSSLNEWLAALRMCEAGGNYNRNSGNGYYGAYQFLPSTWNNIAAKIGRGDLVGVRPDLASPADQDALVIANANMTAGLSTQHPGCYKKLGLSNKPPAQ